MAHNIRIVPMDNCGVCYKTYIDDVEIKGIRSLTFSVGVDQIPTVVMEFNTFHTEISSCIKDIETKIHSDIKKNTVDNPCNLDSVLANEP